MKKNILLGVIIFLLVITVIVETTLLIMQNKPWDKKENKQEENTVKVEETSTPKPIETGKRKLEDEEIVINGSDNKITITKKYMEPNDSELVYTYLDADVTQLNGGQTYSYKFSVPQIYINKANVNSINKEILDIYKDKAENYMKNNKDINFNAESMQYKYFVNDDVLSLIVYITGESAQLNDYKIYNVDKETGEKVTNLSLLEKKKITGTVLIDRIKKSLENLSMYTAKETDNVDSLAFKKQQLTATKDNYDRTDKDAIPLFLDKSGNLISCLYVYPTVGGDSGVNAYLVNLDTGREIELFN